MKKLMLSKYFDRDESSDFRDDGTSFRCYRNADNIRISIAKSNGAVYLSSTLYDLFDHAIVCFDRKYFELYLEANTISDRYNGYYGEISDDDLAKWAEDISSMVKKIKNLPAIKPIIYLNTLDNKYYAMQYERNNCYGHHNESVCSLKSTYVTPDYRDAYKFEFKKIGIID